MIEIMAMDFFQEEMIWLMEQYEHGVALSDFDTSKIIYMNRAFRRLFKIPGSFDMNDLSCASSIKDFFTFHEGSLKGLGGEKEDCAWEYEDSAGGTFLLLRNKDVKWDQKRCRMHVVVDVSSEEKIKKILTQKLHIERTLLDCVNAIPAYSDDDPGATLNAMLKTLGVFYQASRAFILIYDHKRENITIEYEWCKDGAESFINKDVDAQKLLYSGNQPIFSKFLPLVIHDIREIKNTNPFEYAWFAARQVNSVYMVPIMHDHTPAGCVCLDDPVLSIGNFSLLIPLALFAGNQVIYSQMRLQQLHELYHDQLTGLDNRNSYTRWLNARKHRPGRSLGAAIFNINCLKKINIQFGISYGDKIMRNVADILRSQFAKDDVFRFEGDEFLVLAADKSYGNFLSSMDAVQPTLAAAAPEGVTMGLAWSEDPDKDAETVLWDANQSMLANKRRFYERVDRTSRYSNLQMLRRLREEIGAGRFHVYLQPKIDFRRRVLAGMEALIRHVNDNDEVVPPVKYIPVIEKAGFIRYIDFFVLEEVCKTLVSWKKKGLALYPVSLNFSRNTIREPHIAEQVAEIADRYGIPHGHLLIEITESAGDMEREIFIAIGQQFIDKGFGVSLDDFCSEYSCMSLLSALPFAEIKIDRSMLIKVVDDPKTARICEGVISICRSFDSCVVAEGVETQEQVDFLMKTGCDLIQGYYYSRPIPIPSFEEKYLRSQTIDDLNFKEN